MVIPTHLAQLSGSNDREQGQHVVQFYTEDAVLLYSVATRLGAALMAGDAAIIIATEAHRRGMTAELRRRGIDVSCAASEGRYLSLDAAETLSKFMADGAPDAQLFMQAIAALMDQASAAITPGRGRITVFGEMVAVLWEDGRRQAAFDVEKLWNELAQRRPFSLHCAYPISAFDGTDSHAFREICAAHSSVLSPDFLSRPEADLGRQAAIQNALDSQEEEHLRAQRALREANERFRGVFNAASLGIAILTLDARFLEANAQFCHISGYSPEELNNMVWTNLTHPDDCAIMNPMLRKLIAGLIPSFVIEKRYIRKSGKIIWVRTSVSLLRNAKGEPEYLLKLCEDINERKRTEGLLEGQRRILEMIATGATLKKTLTALVRLIEDQTDGMVGSILIRDQQGEHFCDGFAPSLPESYISALRHAPITPPYLGPCGKAAHLGEEVITADIKHDPRWGPQWTALALQHGLQTCYSCPIRAHDGRVLGSFGFYHKEARASAKPRNENLLSTGTYLAGIAIEKKLVEEKLRRNEAELAADLADSRLLQEISAELLHGERVEEFYEMIMDAAVAIMRSDFASMQMFYPERGELRLLAFRGFSPEAARFWEWVKPASASTCGAALSRRERVLVQDIENCAFMAGTEDIAAYRQTGIRAVQSTPLLSRSGKIVGMVSTHWREPHQPSERELRNFDVLARQAADLLERKATEEALHSSEEQFRAIFEQSTGGIAQTDLTGKFTRVNDRYCEITGRSREELLQMHVQDVTHAEDLPQNIRLITALASGSAPNFVIEKRYVRPDGSYVWVRNHVCAIRGADGRPASLAAAVMDITKYRDTEQALRAATEHLEERVLERTAEALAAQNTLRALSARLLQAQDEERRRIARELHDSVGQHLAVLKMTLSLLDPLFGESQRNTARELVEECVSVLDECISETRTISYLLHPPLLDELGLASATHWYVDGFSKRSGIKARVQIPDGLPRLPQNTELTLFRILQEALTNVHRHSGSPSVEIELNCDAGWALLTVRDFGCGIPAEKLARIQGVGAGGVGMAGMRERIADLAGEIQVHSDGHGTLVAAKIPLHSHASAPSDSDVSRSASASD